jgi:hypothetical protein
MPMNDEITLKDYLAGCALTGLLSTLRFSDANLPMAALEENFKSSVNRERLAKIAVQLADELVSANPLQDLTTFRTFSP